MSKQFYYKQFSLASHCLVLFDPEIGPFQVLLYYVKVDQGSIAVKRFPHFPKAPTLLDGWLFGFYGISTFVGYLTPTPF